MKLILDTDPGVDDAIAILMALASGSTAPEGTLVPELVGLTTVGGNVPLARGTRNALALLEYTGLQHIPVARGNARPLRGSFPYSYDFHGKGGLSRRLPEPQARPSASGAIDFLAEQLLNNPGQIALVALGPLTNLARLQQSHPGVLEKSRSLVVMGGAVNTAGNSTPPAEFNFYSDPLAAHRVVSSGAPLTLVDLGGLPAGLRRTGGRAEPQIRKQAGRACGAVAAKLVPSAPRTGTFRVLRSPGPGRRAGPGGAADTTSIPGG